jgi:hypothetical protein
MPMGFHSSPTIQHERMPVSLRSSLYRLAISQQIEAAKEMDARPYKDSRFTSQYGRLPHSELQVT